MLPKNIFILWLEGWDDAEWLNKEVVESWRINNPEWTLHLINIDNLKDYVNDIDYIYEKNINPQAKSDIIRLSLLKNHGGVWADATMLCMQPLDHWVHDAVESSGIWMYHGHGGGMSKEIGPASWFIVSKPESYIITKWKETCDNFWLSEQPYTYFWMDECFKTLFYSDEIFRDLWLVTPYLYCELDGQSHTLAHHGMENDTPHIKQLFKTQPPYALKFWKNWDEIFPTITEDCENSNGYCAIQLSKRRFYHTHEMNYY
jgi:hypothetical protein